MPIFKSVSLIALIALALSPNIVSAASVDIQSDGSRVVIDRGGRVYIRNNEYGEDRFYSDLDDSDWVPSRPSYSRKIYRRGSPRSRYYRSKCRNHSTSYSRRGSSTHTSTMICN
jgi:hypothetical protein